MSDIRTKLLGLTALATAFAGLSYGQAITCSAGTSTNPTLRAEGETELVADATATCTASAGTTGSVYASVSLPVTSKAESAASGGGTFAGNSEAVLQVIGSTTSAYPGTVTGTTISFSGVTYPAGNFTLQVSNVRVNASSGGAPQVTETLLAQYAGPGSVSANATAAAENVGYVLPSLNVSLLQNATPQNVFYGGTTSNFPTCSGEPLSGFTAPTPAFTLLVKEVFAGAFRTLTGPISETGSYTAPITSNLATGSGTATTATQLQVAFANIPAAATVYLPISVSSGGTVLTLQGSVTALTTPASLVGLATSGVFGFTPSGGAVTAVYVVTQASTTGTTFSLPVYIQVGAGLAPVQTTAMTVAVTYIPTASLTGPATLIPTYAASTTAAINTLTVTPCTTTLLFPFVTNASGFETGIAIANMTTDNLKSSGGSSVSPSPGTCTLNFYGPVTQPAAYTTPTIGATAPTFASTLTSMAVPGFTGYAIASCNFLDAHGFAYIVDNFQTSSSTAEGYLAVIVPSSRSSAGDGINTGQ